MKSQLKGDYDFDLKVSYNQGWLSSGKTCEDFQQNFDSKLSNIFVKNESNCVQCALIVHWNKAKTATSFVCPKNESDTEPLSTSLAMENSGT